MKNKPIQNIAVYLILPLAVVIFLYTYIQKLTSEEKHNNNGKSILVETHNNKSTLNWMAHWVNEDKRELFIEEAAREFGFLNQEIELNIDYPVDIYGSSSKSDEANKIIRMIKSNIYDYDVVWLDDVIYQIVAQRLNDLNWGDKYLVDFMKVAEFPSTQKTFLIKNKYYRNITGGIIPGPYIEGYYYTIWYNQKLADKLGLQIKQYGMTFMDLLDYVKAIHNFNDQNQEQKIAAFYESKDWFSMSFLFQNLIKSEINNFKGFDESVFSQGNLDALRKTLNAFEQLAQYSPLEESHNINLWYDTRSLPLDDKTMFYINGTWMYSHWRAIDEEKMKKMVPAELPVFNEVNFTLGGYIPTFAVMKNAPNYKNGIKLLMHFCQPKYGKKWINYTKNPTGIAINSQRTTIKTDQYEEFIQTMNEKYDGRVRFFNNTAYFLGKENSMLKNIVDENIRLVLSNELSAEEAFMNITNNLNI